MRSWVEINLSFLEANFAKIKANLGRKKIAPVIKVNAYGHGLVEVAQVLEKDSNFFGVSTPEEAITLKEAGIKTRALILAPILGTKLLKLIIENEIAFSLPHREELKLVSEIVKKLKRKALLHLEIDTGMHRTGIAPYEVPIVIDVLNGNSFLKLQGVWTHFATADFDLKVMQEQLREFNEIIKKIPKKFSPIIHAANSAAFLHLKESHLDMIRPGILLYGITPREKLRDRLNVIPILSWKTKIYQIKELKRGEGVSYGHTFKARRNMQMAVIGVGYGDGYLRQLSNKAEVIIRGKRAKILGNITMDATMVDVTHIPGVQLEDTVTLIGKDGQEEITAWELAKLSQTIPYHILTNINPKLPRIYLNP